MEAGLIELNDAGIKVIWQTGKYFGDRGNKAAHNMEGVVVTPFISDMGKAYTAATLVVSRAGAGSISELELLGKAAILVPSPNVAEDHQTKNARALSDRGAAVFISDNEAREKLIPEIGRLLSEPGRIGEISAKVREMAQTDSDERIVDEVLLIVNK